MFVECRENITQKRSMELVLYLCYFLTQWVALGLGGGERTLRKWSLCFGLVGRGCRLVSQVFETAFLKSLVVHSIGKKPPPKWYWEWEHGFSAMKFLYHKLKVLTVRLWFIYVAIGVTKAYNDFGCDQYTDQNWYVYGCRADRLSDKDRLSDECLFYYVTWTIKLSGGGQYQFLCTMIQWLIRVEVIGIRFGIF